MQNKIELLDTNLLNLDDFKVFQFWKKALAYQVGWHYPLDIIWLLKEIEKLGLPKGATILDAGAGYGLSQFALAAQGYNIISIDLLPRKQLFPFTLLFRIKNSTSKYKHGNKSYIKHLLSFKVQDISFYKRVFIIFKRLTSWNPFYFLKALIKRRGFGSIHFCQYDISNLNKIKTNSIDAVISVSAIEHIEKTNNIRKAVKEFHRVLKPGSCILITTSTTNKKSWFHKPSRGWCFSRKCLNQLFNVDMKNNKWKNYQKVFNNIDKNYYLKNNIPDYYYYTKKCGLPYGKWEIVYLPVGIKKTVN